MVFRRVEDRNQDLDHPLRIRPIVQAGTPGIRSRRPLAAIAAREKGPRKITDRGDDDGKVIPAIPKPIVRRLVSENLVSFS